MAKDHGDRSLDDRIDALRVGEDEHLDLGERSTDDDFGMSKDEAEERLADTRAAIDELQQRLYAEGTRSVLLVVQAMDAAGKDGTIRHVLTGLNPQGVQVSSFKAPAGAETQHDYLWRVHQVVPRKGEIGVFNRSHYEDVLIVRVKGFAPEHVWKRRYEHIRHFEQLLTDEGTTVVKVFLHVSKDEQARRFQDRLDDPTKRWKFRKGDLDDRALWDDYQEAYRDAIAKTSTKDCPWYVVPADHNAARNMAVGEILRRTLERLDPKFPDPEEGLEGVKVV